MRFPTLHLPSSTAVGSTDLATGSPRIRLARAVAITFCLALLAPLAAAWPAQALTVTVINTDGQGVASRYAPLLSATNGYGAPAGASVTTICWTTGDPVGPNANRLWWLINYAGRQFYAADRYLSTPYVAGSTPSEPRCGAAPAPAPTTREANAVAWAKTQVGVRYTSETSDGIWSGWCERFVERSYGTSYRYSSAQAHYNARRSEMRTTTTPPAGALVFYSYGSLGHVGVSIGGGQVISTKGSGSVAEAVRQHSVLVPGLPFLGWAPAPSSWPGR